MVRQATPRREKESDSSCEDTAEDSRREDQGEIPKNQLLDIGEALLCDAG